MFKIMVPLTQQVFGLPDEVVSHRGGSFLNDVVVDPDDRVAYISDSKAGRIVVFDAKTGAAWTIEHSSMKANPKVEQG